MFHVQVTRSKYLVSPFFMQVGHYDIVACTECEKDATALSLLWPLKKSSASVLKYHFLSLLFCYACWLQSSLFCRYYRFIRKVFWLGYFLGGRESIENYASSPFVLICDRKSEPCLSNETRIE